jgi:hypothetical protein
MLDLNQLKKQKPEAAGSRGAIQALRMENDAHVVGPDAPISNSKMVQLDLPADWNRPTSVCAHHFLLLVTDLIPL